MRFRRSVKTRPVFIETIRKESACLSLLPVLPVVLNVSVP